MSPIPLLVGGQLRTSTVSDCRCARWDAGQAVDQLLGGRWLPDALSAIDGHRFSVEPRLAVDAVLDGRTVTAFNDVAVVRIPGEGSAVVAVGVAGHATGHPIGQTAMPEGFGG